MNCNPRNYSDHIAARMHSWLEVARNAVDAAARRRGRRNFRRLVDAYPEVAASHGFGRNSLQ